MSVQSVARRLAAAIRQAMPAADVSVQHCRRPWGASSYVHVTFAGRWRTMRAKARVSDHGVGLRRMMSDSCSLWLAKNATPASWEAWLCGLQRDYAACGGRLGEGGPMLAMMEGEGA
jgi:hypothetical protein